MRNARLSPRVYGGLLALGAFILLRSFVVQLFWPIDAIDRPDARFHHAFCTAHLLLLQTELQEATWQDMARGLPAPKGFCALPKRRLAWQTRLSAVRARCENSADHVPLGARLAALEAKTCELFEGAEMLWAGEGKALRGALDTLRQ